MEKLWLEQIPTECDICQNPIASAFFDGKTIRGPWAIMCPECHKNYGLNLGTGHGQKYVLDENRNFSKSEG